MKKVIISFKIFSLLLFCFVQSCTKDKTAEQDVRATNEKGASVTDRDGGSSSSTFCSELPSCNQNWTVQVLEVFPANSEYYVQIDAFDAPVCADDICDGPFGEQCCVQAFRSAGYNVTVPTNGRYGINTPVLGIGQYIDLWWFYTRKYFIELHLRDAAGNIIYYNEANPNSAFIRLRFRGKGFLPPGTGTGDCTNVPPPVDVTVYPADLADPFAEHCPPLYTVSCCGGLGVEACE